MSNNKQIESVPFIEGEKINLCPSNSDHLSLYAKWWNSPEIRKFARSVFPKSIEDLKKNLEPSENTMRERLFFEIWHKADNKPIGYAGLEGIRWFDRRASLFYVIGEKQYWGKGFATEASSLIVNYGFNELNLHKITAGAFSPNKASICVLKKVGFQFELTRKKEIYIDGQFVDSQEYSILKREWNKTGE
ncbi:MAG: GNAT family N-acetyltransferase [Promethearchaeota archaeon]|jgi:RimJ/RimL family protein N-acetyltransferase